MSNDQVARDAAQHGYIAVTFEYDISAPGRWPREVDDVRAVIAWARSQASQWGGDPGKIATWGTSAGANLAVEVAAAGDHSGLSADVGWSGPYLLQALPQQATTGEQQVAATADPFIYLNCFIQLCPEEYVAASPALSATPGMPPTYLANSSNELVPVGQQDAMVNTLQRLTPSTRCRWKARSRGRRQSLQPLRVPRHRRDDHLPVRGAGL